MYQPGLVHQHLDDGHWEHLAGKLMFLFFSFWESKLSELLIFGFFSIFIQA